MGRIAVGVDAMNTRRFPRTMQQAFGAYCDHRLHPMPEPGLWQRFLVWLTGQPDNLETTK
jgi:hypothetical protein